MLKKLRQSHLWPKEPHDYYVEPRWCSQRLFETEPFEGTIVDPCCGMGRILESAAARGYPVIGMDLVDRGPHAHKMDFMVPQGGRTWDNIVSNPPFGLCKTGALVAIALARTRQKLALLLPYTFLFGEARSRWLESTPLYKVRPLCPRPSMPPGRLVEQGLKPSGGRVDYAFFIWLKGYHGSWLLEPLREKP